MTIEHVMLEAGKANSFPERPTPDPAQQDFGTAVRITALAGPCEGLVSVGGHCVPDWLSAPVAG